MSEGSGPGQFASPHGLALLAANEKAGIITLYVVDSGNYPIQAFNAMTGAHLKTIGNGKGNQLGRFNNPRHILVYPRDDGKLVPVCFRRKE